ncbi:MAG: hypothetical protein KDC00_10935 [Flavobacteriales bacterium]|nr:hypothetical protein [Flavobacteriales bacterium]
MRPIWSVIALTTLVLAACRKEEPNPFDELERRTSVPDAESIPQDNFAWIHQRILRPNCALSGCHDGTFEPEFRGVGSAYNSLVFHPVTSNNATESFVYRVVPGDVQASILHERLNVVIPNTSGIMPLGYAEDSDWPANAAAYRAAIDNWIATGARDMFGALPSEGNLEPQVAGMLAFPAGNTSSPFPRGDAAGVQPIEVPAGTIDLWFAFSDDATESDALTYNKLKVATQTTAFETVPELPLVVNATISGPDFSNSNTTFTHRVQLMLGTYAPGTTLFVRVYVDDGSHDGPTEIPNDGTSSPMLDYFTLRIVG